MCLRAGPLHALFGRRLFDRLSSCGHPSRRRFHLCCFRSSITRGTLRRVIDCFIVCLVPSLPHLASFNLFLILPHRSPAATCRLIACLIPSLPHLACLPICHRYLAAKRAWCPLLVYPKPASTLSCLTTHCSALLGPRPRRWCTQQLAFSRLAAAGSWWCVDSSLPGCLQAVFLSRSHSTSHTQAAGDV